MWASTRGSWAGASPCAKRSVPSVAWVRSFVPMLRKSDTAAISAAASAASGSSIIAPSSTSAPSVARIARVDAHLVGRPHHREQDAQVAVGGELPRWRPAGRGAPPGRPAAARCRAAARRAGTAGPCRRRSRAPARWPCGRRGRRAAARAWPRGALGGARTAQSRKASSVRIRPAPSAPAASPARISAGVAAFTSTRTRRPSVVSAGRELSAISRARVRARASGGRARELRMRGGWLEDDRALAAVHDDRARRR